MEAALTYFAAYLLLCVPGSLFAWALVHGGSQGDYNDN